MTELSLSDRFFLLLHDEFTGRPRAGQERLAAGVVATGLATLLIAGRLGVVDGRVMLGPHSRAPVDPDTAADAVLERVRGEPALHDVPTWLSLLGEATSQAAAQRLVDTGVLRREQGRGFGRRRTVWYPAVDLLKAAGPRVRLARMLRAPQEFTLEGAVLVATLAALGLETVLDPELDRQATTALVTDLWGHLPTELAALLTALFLYRSSSTNATTR